ncbi:hypothetical protein CF327_g1564 [Tilletia walkeri]|nr:hypothetical protein CF327_g1564 [Tilletia walkeri]
MRLLETLAVFACVLPQAFAIWPRPASLTQGNSTIRIDVASFYLTPPPSVPDDLAKAIQRTETAIRRDRMSPLVVGRGEDRRSAIDAAPTLETIRIQLGESNGTAASSSARNITLKSQILQPVEEHDEAYELYIPSDGTPGILSATSSLGILRGLATLEQLFFDVPGAVDAASDPLNPFNDTPSLVNVTANATRYMDGVPLNITDRPAFPWRGLLLDTSRNFFSVPAIERTLDAMAFVKLNMFHWHIVDAQSFPLQLPGKLAVLSEKGAYSPDMVYTSDDIAHLVDYAAARGINVNVEIDMPGHMYEGVRDYDPSIIVCPNQRDWPSWANEPPSGQIALNNTAAQSFASDLIAATASLFPSPYFSTGGDEVNLACYNATTPAQIDATLLKPFIESAHDAVVKAGKRPLVWEEMAINFPETGKSLRNGTIVEAWTSSVNVEAILKSTNEGVKLIHAPSDFFYLDCGAGGWLGDAPDRQSWCPFVTWQKSYTFDPFNGTQNIPNGQARVLGGEAALWSEQADEFSLDGYLWPRAGSAAEVFWTGASYLDAGLSASRNVTEALPRLHELRFRLVDRGYAARPLQPYWCALRPGECDLV